MSLTGPQLQQIHAAIVGAYSNSREAFKFAVKTCLDVDFDAYALEGGFSDQVSSFLLWANEHGKAWHVLRCAWENNQGNDRLAALWREAQSWKEAQDDSLLPYEPDVSVFDDAAARFPSSSAAPSCSSAQATSSSSKKR